MSWVDAHDLLHHAYRNRYAVGGFDASRLDFIEAIVAAAERCRSPVILNLSESEAGHNDFELTVAAAERAARRATVPVALHYQRARSPDAAVRAINLGCNAITAAAARESFPANVAQARRLAEIARACGVTIEGELAPIAGAGDGEAETPASAEEAKAFVQRTQVDCLAVPVGAIAARTRGRVKLDIDRLRRVSDAVRIPLVIRTDRATTDEHCHKLIQHGVAKVNFSSLLDAAAGEHLRVTVRRDPHCGYTGLLRDLHATLESEVERCLHRCGSAGRAAEVLVQCRTWQPVEHVIIYNVERATEDQVQAMMARGRETLARIPGVRRVFTGWAVPEQPRFRFCWLVEFVHAQVIDSYRNHPAHVEFADQLFRPVAGDRISIDFAAERDTQAMASDRGRRQGSSAG